jgi:hypothetical protein
MLGNYFYHKIIRKTVTTFGTLFNNVQIKKYDAQGNFVKQEKVPLAYGPMQKFLARLKQNPDIDRNFTINVPRLSFEMTAITYDGSRKVPPIQQNRVVNNETKGYDVQYMPVPYNVEFELGIITKSQDDALQILEQILPFFQPQFTVTIVMIPEMDEKRDIPITLNSVDFNDEYEGDLMERRTITYTLRFTAKTYLYGPISSGDIIKKSIANINIGDKVTNARILKYQVQPEAISDQDGDSDIDAVDTALLTAEDDFGFNEGIEYYGP